MAVYYDILSDFHECIFELGEDERFEFAYEDGTKEIVENPFTYFNEKWQKYCQWWNAQPGHHNIDPLMFYNYAINK